ncbi:MAG: hypothetical protein D6790_05290, partial [Caldilineae bacterium]
LTVFPTSAANARALRARLPWLNPVPLGLRTSAGFGDRLGIATPGHILAVRGTGVAPIFAQQSVRENTRTGRTPQNVLDDAMWGVLQMGWQEDWGADADHMKTIADIDPFVDAGYTFFTIDPGDHVDDDAETADDASLAARVEALPWDALESSPDALRDAYLRRFELDDRVLEFDRHLLHKAAAKYGRAIAHTAKMARHLEKRMGGRSFDLEMSVDETYTTTTLHEHLYIVGELNRLGVRVVSLAPRFVGRFEKGVDYIGDLDELDANIAGHAAVMRFYGNAYKLSIHTGSDKFGVYPIAMHHTRGLVHLKTAGTSYLEALRVMAAVDVGFFREVLDFARSRYEEDRKTYHVSAVLEKVPPASALRDDQLPDLLNQFDARQVLHVTFGSVLDRYGDRLQAMLRAHEDEYQAALKAHFDRHLAPLNL